MARTKAKSVVSALRACHVCLFVLPRGCADNAHPLCEAFDRKRNAVHIRFMGVICWLPREQRESILRTYTEERSVHAMVDRLARLKRIDGFPKKLQRELGLILHEMLQLIAEQSHNETQISRD